jgi:hypothetical protein
MTSNDDVFGLTERPMDAKLKRAQSLVGTSDGRPSDDWYPTPVMATEALLRVEKFSGSVLEPACGDGAISKIFEAHGFIVKSTDLINRGYGEAPYDFVSKDYPFNADNIITNPPFSLAQEFIECSLERTTQKVVMLGKLQLLESAKRKTLFETTPLEKVWIFSKRITMARNGEYEKYSSSMICFAWFVWNHKYRGEPKIGWI